MEENEIMLLKNSKMYVTRVGNRMNVFSILTVIGTLFLAVGGIALLFMSNMLPEDTPFYIDNIMGLAGLGLLVLAVAIVPAVVYMRLAMRMANELRATQEIYPVVNFLRESHKMWRYLTTLLYILLVVGVVAMIIAAIYLLPMVRNM